MIEIQYFNIIHLSIGKMREISGWSFSHHGTAKIVLNREHIFILLGGGSR